jgi:cell fate regulator YaaT (PSP1 superfamily)
MGDEDMVVEDQLEEQEASTEASEATGDAERDAATPEAPPAKAAPPAPLADGRTLWRVKVLYSSATEFCDAPPGMAIAVGDCVVVPTRYGNELGKVLGSQSDPSAALEIHSVVRVASPADMARVNENDMKEGRAYELCREKVAARGLEMKLVSAHYLLDEQKILFFFTAENRVDFRELVKDLVAQFKMRIELRQIGVRDEARVVGGMGICGRALCCNSITDKLRPVSIKMAKEQNLTLNSMKISGPCGRLLCCLSYEFDVYREARQALPSMGTRVRFDDEDWKVVDLNVLARRVRFQAETGRVLDVGFESLTRNPQTQAWELSIRGSATGAAP